MRDETIFNSSAIHCIIDFMIEGHDIIVSSTLFTKCHHESVFFSISALAARRWWTRRFAKKDFKNSSTVLPP